MWRKLQACIQSTRSILIITPSIALAIVIGQTLGLFNLLEWKLRDEWVRLRFKSGIADEIVIVTIDERDIQLVGKWPIPDWSLAKLLEKIRQQKPRSIGLDLYRDLPEGNGHEQLVQVFRTTPNLIGVEKITGERVNPSPELKKHDRVGLADFVLDSDLHIRRALLTAIDVKEEGKIKAGLAVQVALKYLESEKIVLESVDEKQQRFRLGKTVYQPLKDREAGYSDADVGGYQILLNWHGSETAFHTVTMRDVLAGKISANLMRDRMVFIGSTAASTNDFFSTPFSSSLISAQKPTPGVVIHANIALQLVRGAKTSKNNLQGISDIFSSLWIVLWCILGSGGSFWLASGRSQWRFPGGKILWATVGLSGILIGSSYYIFLSGVLIPVTPALVGFISSVIATTNAYKQRKLEEANQQLEIVNNQLLDYSKTLEIKVEERTRELLEAKQAADDANQAKSEFLSNMSHELRTPLNGILGFAQVLVQSPNLTKKNQEEVNVIHQCGSHLLMLINDILDLSKIEARKLELVTTTIHLPSFLQSVTEICGIRAEQKGINFNILISDELPLAIQTDEKRLRQVLINLLGNAIKFTDNGSVTFKVDVISQESLVICQESLVISQESLVKSHSTEVDNLQMTKDNSQMTKDNSQMTKDNSQMTKDNSQMTKDNSQMTKDNSQMTNCNIRFLIEDTGVGMSSDRLEKIFLPFEQVGSAQQRSEGTGLGLTISQRIAALMGSQIQVQSHLGEGSLFWLDLTVPLTCEWNEDKTTLTEQQIIGIRGDTPQHLISQSDGIINRELILPSQEVLQQLYHLAMMGDILEIEEILDNLVKTNQQLTLFTAELSKLTTNFQTAKIRNMLKSCLAMESSQ